RDTMPGATFAGAAAATITLAGSLDTLDATFDATARHLHWNGAGVVGLAAQGSYTGGARPSLRTSVVADSAELGGVHLAAARLEVAGFLDSLGWALDVTSADSSHLATVGRYLRDGDARIFALDTLGLQLAEHRWRLTEPGGLRFDGPIRAVQQLDFVTVDGLSGLRFSGVVPSPYGGYLQVGAYGVSIRDLYTLLQKDTVGVGGLLGMNLAIGGTLNEPTIQGSATIAEPGFGEFKAPFVQGRFNYDKRLLDANLFFWKTGQRVLEIEASLPLDLAFVGVEKRQLPGPIAVRARADSVDLGVLEAFTRNVRRASGQLVADVQVGGTWSEPRLAGSVHVRDGAMTVPGLGVRYTGLTARLTLAGDSIAVDTFRVRSGRGNLAARGSVRLPQLTAPQLDLRVDLDDFQAINTRDFLSLDASGNLRLTGPVVAPTLTGLARAKTATLYFADLISKRIVDLQDPESADLVDLSVLERRRLGADFQSRLLDSLRVDNLEVQMGDQVWLRSNEANVQLEGAMRVSKLRKQYRVDGALNARRGTYALTVGPVVRDFVVNRGTVRFFGTPDLNAEIDIEATHVVRPLDGGSDIPVIARITGTLLQPRLALQTDVKGAALSQTDLVSYLMFGRPSFAVGGVTQGTAGQNLALNAGVSYLSSALSTEVQRMLVSDLGVPIDYLVIKPGINGLTQLAAGWQLGGKWFISFSAGVCAGTQFTPRNFGASLEYRFRPPSWRLQASAEPVRICSTNPADPLALSNRYQFGADILWEREW
ncbi:MAG: translocation/assembly module TamB domain-containing protein, partial [Gemmatimonadota bacterium]